MFARIVPTTMAIGTRWMGAGSRAQAEGRPAVAGPILW